MQETCNNCFGSKICITTVCQVKTSEHECRNITAAYVAVTFPLLYYHYIIVRPKTIVASFLHLMVLLSKVLLNHSIADRYIDANFTPKGFNFYSPTPDIKCSQILQK